MNEFWYRRTECLAGVELQPRPDADWRRVYRSVTLTREQQESIDCEDAAIWRGLDSLSSLLVLKEIYGEPIWNQLFDLEARETVWHEISNPEALEYVLSNEWLDCSDRMIFKRLGLACSRGEEQMVQLLLDLTSDTDNASPKIGRFVSIADENGFPVISEMLTAYLEQMTLEREGIFAGFQL